eukprot:6193275-Pyramimonas_sp.AAC.1
MPRRCLAAALPRHCPIATATSAMPRRRGRGGHRAPRRVAPPVPRRCTAEALPHGDGDVGDASAPWAWRTSGS